MPRFSNNNEHNPLRKSEVQPQISKNLSSAAPVTDLDFIKIFGGSMNELTMIKQMMQSGRVTVNGQKVTSVEQTQQARHAKRNNTGTRAIKELSAQQKPPRRQNLPPTLKSNQKPPTLPQVGRSDGFRRSINREVPSFDKLGVDVQTRNDSEIKVEKALIELNEIKNDIIF